MLLYYMRLFLDVVGVQSILDEEKYVNNAGLLGWCTLSIIILFLIIRKRSKDGITNDKLERYKKREWKGWYSKQGRERWQAYPMTHPCSQSKSTSKPTTHLSRGPHSIILFHWIISFCFPLFPTELLALSFQFCIGWGWDLAKCHMERVNSETWQKAHPTNHHTNRTKLWSRDNA